MIFKGKNSIANPPKKPVSEFDDEVHGFQRAEISSGEMACSSRKRIS